MTMKNSKPKIKNHGNSGAAALPPKPYTEYTIFFRLERTRILQSSGIIDEEILSSLNPNHVDTLEFPRPIKYQTLAMLPYWYSSSHRAALEKKRKHRKREGRMDLKTLSKTVSASWRSADPIVVEYCRKLAKAELEKYDALIEDIIIQQEKKNKAASAVTSSTTMTMMETQLSATSPPRSNAASWMLPDGALSLNEFVFRPNNIKQADVTVSSNTSPMSFCNNNGNYNKVNGYVQVSQGPDEAFLKMRQLQQLQMAHANNGMNHTSVRSTSPAQKRKFVRRASAPPEFMCQGVTNIVNNGSNMAHMPFNLGNNNFMVPTSMGSCNSTNVFLGEDNGNPTKQMKNQQQFRRRSSTSSVTSMIPNQAQLQELGEAFRRASMPGSMASNNSEVFNMGTAYNSQIFNIGTCPADDNISNMGTADNSQIFNIGTCPADDNISNYTKLRTFNMRRRCSLASTAPSIEHHELSPSFKQELMSSSTNSGLFNIGTFNSIDSSNNNYNNNKPKTFKMRRQSSMASMESHQELRSSFQQVLKDASGSSFTAVPAWEKKDVDMLLDILNVEPEDNDIITIEPEHIGVLTSNNSLSGDCDDADEDIWALLSSMDDQIRSD